MEQKLFCALSCECILSGWPHLDFSDQCLRISCKHLIVNIAHEKWGYTFFLTVVHAALWHKALYNKHICSFTPVQFFKLALLTQLCKYFCCSLHCCSWILGSQPFIYLFYSLQKKYFKITNQILLTWILCCKIAHIQYRNQNPLLLKCHFLRCISINSSFQ